MGPPGGQVGSACGERFEIRVDHHPDQLFEPDLGLPAELAPGLGRVTDQEVHLSGPEELLVDTTWSCQRSPTWSNAISQSSRTGWVSPVATT